jgi:hypothetical protein
MTRKIRFSKGYSAVSKVPGTVYNCNNTFEPCVFYANLQKKNNIGTVLRLILNCRPPVYAFILKLLQFSTINVFVNLFLMRQKLGKITNNTFLKCKIFRCDLLVNAYKRSFL